MGKIKDSSEHSMLNAYLAYTGVDDIANDKIRCEAERDEILAYLASHMFDVSEADKQEMKDRGYDFDDYKAIWDEDTK